MGLWLSVRATVARGHYVAQRLHVGAQYVVGLDVTVGDAEAV